MTTKATTRERITWFSDEKRERGESKYTYVEETGEIVCNTAEKAVSNCDIIVR